MTDTAPTPDLPDLPEPELAEVHNSRTGERELSTHGAAYYGSNWRVERWLYTADQMHTYAADCVRAALAHPAPAAPVKESLTTAPAEPAEPLCACKDRPASQCPGQWEPGCDLGNNPAHVRVIDAPAEPAEPVAHEVMMCPNSACGWMGKCLKPGECHSGPGAWVTSSAAPPQPPAEQQGAEPVAEVCSGWALHWAGNEPLATLLARHPNVRIGTKLYAAQPPQPVQPPATAQPVQAPQPLTDAQIKDCVWGYVEDSNNIPEAIVGIIRAVEAHHGIGAAPDAPAPAPAPAKEQP